VDEPLVQSSPDEPLIHNYHRHLHLQLRNTTTATKWNLIHHHHLIPDLRILHRVIVRMPKEDHVL
jgi:hypothetical protein